MRYKWMALSLVFVLVLSVAAFAASPYKVGDTIPAETKIALTDLDGVATDLVSEVKNGKAVVVFMNSSCSACNMELKLVSQMLAGGMNADLLVISVDMGDSARVKVHKDRFFLRGKWFHDPDFTVAPLFGFAYTPATLVIDSSGKVLMAKGGYDPAVQGAFVEAIENAVK